MKVLMIKKVAGAFALKDLEVVGNCYLVGPKEILVSREGHGNRTA